MLYNNNVWVSYYHDIYIHGMTLEGASQHTTIRLYYDRN